METLSKTILKEGRRDAKRPWGKKNMWGKGNICKKAVLQGKYAQRSLNGKYIRKGLKYGGRLSRREQTCAKQPE